MFYVLLAVCPARGSLPCTASFIAEQVIWTVSSILNFLHIPAYEGNFLEVTSYAPCWRRTPHKTFLTISPRAAEERVAFFDTMRM